MTAPALLLDSSVLIKWFRASEELRLQALDLRQRYLNGELSLTILDLSLYEITNALRYKPDLNAEDVAMAAESLWDLGIHVLPVSKNLLVRAVRLAYASGMTVYDAAFVSAALEEGIPLVTADRKLPRCANPHGTRTTRSAQTACGSCPRWPCVPRPPRPGVRTVVCRGAA